MVLMNQSMNILNTKNSHKYQKGFYFAIITATIFLAACVNLKKVKTEEKAKPEEISYSSSVKSIIKTNCIGCHSGSSPAGGTALTTYKSVRTQTENGNLLKRINDINAPMPKNGLMDLELREVIKQWSLNGYKLDTPQQDSTSKAN